MEYVAIALCVIAIAFLLALIVGFMLLWNLFMGRVEIKIQKHNLHEVVQPPVTPEDKKAAEEYAEFAKQQAAFANDTVKKVQALFLDDVEENDGK